VYRILLHVRDVTECVRVVNLVLTLDTDIFCVGVQALVPWWVKCLMSVVNTLRSGVYHLLHMCQVWIRGRIKCFTSECLFVCYLNLFNSFVVSSFVVSVADPMRNISEMLFPGRTELITLVKTGSRADRTHSQ